jgi:hypothetical protein
MGQAAAAVGADPLQQLQLQRVEVRGCTDFGKFKIIDVYSFMDFGNDNFLDCDAWPAYSSCIGCSHHVLSCVATLISDDVVLHDSQAEIMFRCRAVVSCE